MKTMMTTTRGNLLFAFLIDFVCTALFLAAIFAFFANIGCANANPPEYDDRIMVMGDSISIGYQPFIPNSVHSRGQPEWPLNARYSAYTVAHMEEWLDAKIYRAIVFNNGLHDIMVVPTPIEQYRANMEKIADGVLRHTAHPIFVLSTQTLDPTAPDSTVQAYNQAAREVMQARRIPVVDLYSVSTTIASTHYDLVHFNDVGSKALADAIKLEIQ